jgi:hypothetical protein
MFVVSLLLGACKGSQSASDGGGDSSALDDGGATLGCSGFVQCFDGCAGGDGACVAQCTGRTTAIGQILYQKALYCGQSWCLALNDLGSGDCVLDPTMTKLVDPAGKPAGTCNQCLGNALAQLYGTACTSSSDPSCNPMDCQPFYMSCTADLP